VSSGSQWKVAWNGTLPYVLGHTSIRCCDDTGNEFCGLNPDTKKKNAGQNSYRVKFYIVLQIDNDQVGTQGRLFAGNSGIFSSPRD
jgi:hypothetical protein